MDRLCLQRLLQLSETLKVERQSASIFPWPVGDLSQKVTLAAMLNDGLAMKLPPAYYLLGVTVK